jgi:curved DNA binding protein
MVTHQILRNVLDGPKQVILNPSENQRKDTETVTFSEGEAYSIDIVVSSGEGKPKVLDTRTTIYKRNSDAVYNLKMKASRAVFSDVIKNYGSMAFTLRSFEDEKKGRLGIMECASHGLVTPYSVLYESNDAHVAHLMFTVLLMPAGPLKITSFPWDEGLYKSSLAIKDESIAALLKTPVRASKKSKKKKTAAKE